MVTHPPIIDKETVWRYLSCIPDPDIPVVSITELGLVRGVEVIKDKVIVTLTPSYSGCPAMSLFKNEITTTLKNIGVENLEIKTVYQPAWSTDWITETAREKMKQHGIAPPEQGNADTDVLFSQVKKNITCPRCGTTHTKLISQFGSTPCKALWFCDHCHQPFEYFKCH